MIDNITYSACGKLNLFLDIVGRREDGYHLLETVMQSVSVRDILHFEVRDGEGIELRCETEGFPLNESNLICKAARRFCEMTGAVLPGRLIVTVEKNIPSMAGMGGGSADCAATLEAMNALCGTDLTSEELLAIGQSLGADVPFTMIGGTAFCQGTGELMTPLPTRQDIWYAAVQPDFRVSTAAAYRACDEAELSAACRCRDFITAYVVSPRAAAEKMYNVFEQALLLPEISEIKRKMTDAGALEAMLTGSGSVIFGVFDDPERAQRCAESFSHFGFAEVLTPEEHGITQI